MKMDDISTIFIACSTSTLELDRRFGPPRSGSYDIVTPTLRGSECVYLARELAGVKYPK